VFTNPETARRAYTDAMANDKEFDGEFFEEDEPIEDILRAWERGQEFVTQAPFFQFMFPTVNTEVSPQLCKTVSTGLSIVRYARSSSSDDGAVLTSGV
jgi:hypothetical protein